MLDDAGVCHCGASVLLQLLLRLLRLLLLLLLLSFRVFDSIRVFNDHSMHALPSSFRGGSCVLFLVVSSQHQAGVHQYGRKET